MEGWESRLAEASRCAEWGDLRTLLSRLQSPHSDPVMRVLVTSICPRLSGCSLKLLWLVAGEARSQTQVSGL